MLVGVDSGVTIVDVKAAGKLADPAVQAVFAWTRRLVTWRGWVFEMWLGPDAVVLENVRFLAGYRRDRLVETGLIPVVMETAATQSTIGAIEHAVQAPPVLVRPVVLHLLWSGRLACALDRRLGPDTPVRVREGTTT